MNHLWKNVPVMNDCRKVEHTLWLKYTDKYNYINAYNLGYLAKLAYSRVVLDNTKPANLDFQHFIDKARETFRDCETPDLNKVKLTQIKNEKGEISSGLIPFITLVEPEKGIQEDETGYVEDKSVSVSALFYMDETSAVIAVRGTQESKDIGIDADALQVKPAHNIKGEVHQGFYQQANAIIKNENFDRFMKQFKAQNKDLYITGHSLGGAVATILSAYLVEQGFRPLLYTFGSPRVGNTTFVKYYNNKFTHFRHVNDFDVVPVLPGRVLDGNIDKIIKNAIKAGLKGEASPLMAGVMSIFNWQGDSYTHHGNLCQIIGDGDVKIMLPFSLHEISQLRMADMNEEQFKKKEDRVHLTKLNISYHSMDTYLSNLEQIIKDLYHFYKVDNRCKRETIENCAAHSLHYFIQRSKTKLNNRINALQGKIDKINQEVQAIIKKTGHTIPLPTSTFRIQEKEIKLCRELLKKLEQIEKIKIDQYELYSLYVGHPDVAKQLNRLVGVK
ncbi:lipase family protein [Actinobacillus capsulatus]|uniref:lipase family protein n=1 Tax=Actinobacillus capsulatus TaxID=717 RepID=UPI00036F0148|nr:lipase family protein [Actinobacillus capsulatus]